jgi:DnaJ-class molecular chaperone
MAIFERMKTCQNCFGNGRVGTQTKGFRVCESCDGTGEVPMTDEEIEVERYWDEQDMRYDREREIDWL